MFLPFPEGWHPRTHRVFYPRHTYRPHSRRAPPSLCRDGAHNPDICRFSGNKTRVPYRRSPPENRYCFRLIKKRAARYPNNALQNPDVIDFPHFSQIDSRHRHRNNIDLSILESSGKPKEFCNLKPVARFDIEK